MSLTKLEPASRIGDQVFDAIHDAIQAGQLPAGSRLQIRKLADELGTSVMPVREAIKRLEEVGVVESVPYRGAVVKTYTSTELEQVYAVRRLLETEASRLGVAHLDQDAIDRLRDLRGAMSDALVERAEVAYVDNDEGFLTEIYAHAGNAVLVETIKTLWMRCRPYKLVGVRKELDAGQQAPLLVYQDQLLEAAIRRDQAAAAQITSASLEAATQRIRSVLSTARQTIGAESPAGDAPA